MKRRVGLVAITGVTVLLLQSLGVAAGAAGDPVDGLVVSITDTTPRADSTVPFSTSGSWSASAVDGPGGYPSLYSNAVGAVATWRPDVAVAGSYRVEVAIPDAPNSITSVTYTVRTGTDSRAATIDQSVTRGTWASLGLADFPAGTGSSIELTTIASGSLNNRVSALRLVPEDEPVGDVFFEDFQSGMAGWTAMSSTVDQWSVTPGAEAYTTVANSGPSGYYIRPTAAVNLPEAYELTTRIRIDSIQPSGSVSLLTDMLEPYSYVANNHATQFTKFGTDGTGRHQVAVPNSGTMVCQGQAPIAEGEWFDLMIQRAGGVIAVWADGKLISATALGTAGGTIALGAYLATFSIGEFSVASLSSTPPGQPSSVLGCTWPPAATDLFFEDYSEGMSNWTAMSGSTADWVVDSDIVTYTTVDNSGSSGWYIRPTESISLPENYEINTTVRLNSLSTSGAFSLLTDMREPYSYTARNLAVQFSGPSGDVGGMRVAMPNAGTQLCTGSAPYSTGEWFSLRVRRAGGVLATWVDGQLVSSVTPGPSGGTIALGAYHADVSVGASSVVGLSGVPSDQPGSATGCTWSPPTEPVSGQPVIANQSGFNLGQAKRFTAPSADDGDTFEIRDADGDIRFSGTVQDQVGDFTAFDPADTGPFTITVTGAAGVGESYPFGIGADWMERVSYERAVQFMTDVRCFYGDMSAMTFGGSASDCLAGVGWRDSHQLSFEIPSMIDLYLSNPSAFQQITEPAAVYTGMKYPLPADTPEIVRLIAWGVETYLKGEVNHTLLKEQLAAFLYAYPQLSKYIPVGLYEEARDYLFPIWGSTEKNRYAWYDYTAHTADLFQTYTQIGTGKGEFPVGHSVAPNVQMYEVALREGRTDAQDYLDAAVNQAEWIVENVDVTDPLVTKGQRQGEYHLISGLAKLQLAAPDAVPAGLAAFVQDWADTVTERSDNIWDFHKYSDDRWTIPSFTGGGSGEDPNEVGNVLGFPAAALAAVHILGEGDTSDRLREIAVAQVDDVFGRNPAARMSSYRGPTEDYGFEGVDRGWFREFAAGNGKLQGSRGVFDAAPKNGLYPYNPAAGDPGHSEGWVTFNTAWNEALAWRAFDATSLSVDASDPEEGSVVSVSLVAPLNMDAAGGNTAEVLVAVNDAAPTGLPVSQRASNSLDYLADLDLNAVGAVEIDTVTISYGLGYFERSTSFTVTAAGSGPVEVGPSASLSVSTVPAGDQVTITGDGFASGESITAVLHSKPVPLGTLVADGSGAFTRTFTIPADTTPGAHSLVLTGQSSGSVSLALTVTAPAAAPESDLASTGATIGELLLLASTILGSAVIIVALRRGRITHHR